MDCKEYMLDVLEKLIAVPSPTGMTKACALKVFEELQGMGFAPEISRKGTVTVTVAEGDHPLLLTAHIDTLGAFVRSVKENGCLRYSKIGGWNDNAIENENVIILTRDGKRFTGTVQCVKASRHIWGDHTALNRNDETLEIVLDEDVHSKAQTVALGIEAGDLICFEPRFTVTESGYIKSRFMDDKAASAVLLTLARDIKAGTIKPSRGVTLAFTVFEEIGHGASALAECGCEDMIAVDMGCVGGDLNGRETDVCICAKDAAGPYDFDLTNELIANAKALGLEYAVDVYQNYSSDAATALKAGLDARFAMCGMGVFASHAYERTHINGMMNTLRLIEAMTLK